jgi:hypothetical protein
MYVSGLSCHPTAGRPCHICGERILLAAEGRGCPACDLAWHLTCTENPALCPACGRDAAATGKEIAERQQRELWKYLDRGRMLYRTLLALHILLALAMVIAILQTDESLAGDLLEKGESGYFSSSHTFAIVRVLCEFVFFFGLWLAAYFGKTGARYLLGAGAGLSLILGLIVAVGDTFLPDGFRPKIPVKRGTRAGHTPPPRPVRSLGTGQYIVLILAGGTVIYRIWICFGSRSIRDYEAALLSRQLHP